ncbi:hypothetical protein [Hirschia litorea]|uniref:Uncharacterized protein n=1 Tax=Hirschia litorea TaxID=1199156 RepID=A0ABW2IQ40_9PROT
MSIELGNNLKMVWNWGNFLSEDTMPRIINTESNTLVCKLEGHTDYIRGAIVLSDGRLATWSNDLSARIWQLDGRCDLILRGHNSYTYTVLELEDNRLLTSDGKGTLFCWNLKTGDRQWRTPLPKGVDCFGGLDLCSQTHNRVLAKCYNSWVLYNLEKGDIIRVDTNAEGCHEAWKINEELALVHNQKQAELIAWSDGEKLAEFQLPGYKTKILPVGNDRIVVAHKPFLSDFPAKFMLFAITRKEGELIDECSISNDDILWMKHDVSSDTVTISLADYHQVHLSLSPFGIKNKTGSPGRLSAGFTSFAPELSIADPTTHLNVSRMHKQNGFITSLEGIYSADQVRASGLLDNGRLCVRHFWDWRIYRPDFKQYEPLSHDRMKVKYPDYIKKLEWQDIIRRDLHTRLAAYMAQRLDLPMSRIQTQIDTLKQTQNGKRVKFVACHDGTIAAWDVAEGNLWHIGEDLVINQLAVEDKELFLHGNLILSPKGIVHRLIDNRCVPIKTAKGKPLMFHPDYRGSFNRVRWCSGDRLVMRQGTGVAVSHPQTGEQIDFLDGGNDMSNWGFVELRNGTLITWTRLSLRSWSAKDYSPLVELQDPEDWGPGYEQVIAFGNRVGFYVGDYSSDHRIMIWDGETSLGVYGGHLDEIQFLQQIKPDTFLSLAGRNGANNFEAHLWQVPAND